MSDEIARREDNPLARIPSVDIADAKWWSVADVAPAMGYADPSGLRKLIANNREDFEEGVEVRSLTGSEASDAWRRLCEGKESSTSLPQRTHNLILLSLLGIEMAAVLSGTAGARHFRRQLLAQRRAARLEAPRLSEADVRRIVREEVATLRVLPAPPLAVAPVATLDCEAALDSWERLFGSERISATAAYRSAKRAPATDALRLIANKSQHVGVFGMRLVPLVNKTGRRLIRGTTGAYRFYKLIDS